MKRTSQEVWGLRIELLGLILALGTAMFQAAIVDWFTGYQRDSIAVSQESVNLDVLASIQQLAHLIASPTEDLRRYGVESVERSTSHGTNTIDEYQRQRKRVTEGQQAIFAKIRLWLFFIGAALVILGKYLVMDHKHETAQQDSTRPKEPSGPP